MEVSRIRGFVVLLVLVLLGLVQANDANNDDQYNADDANNDDGQVYEDDDYQGQNQGDDYIKYWTEYAILPKRCIVYNNVDVIVFSVFEHGYKQCSDTPMGTYIAPVPTFVNAYMEQLLQNEQDQGNEDYSLPNEVQYTECYRQVIQNKEYWLQVGCTDGTSQALSVNIYQDNTCTTRSTVNGFDDSNIDVSQLQLPFKKCQPCVNWVDFSDDAIDDQFYENHQTQAPLCSTAWQSKQDCDNKCQKTGLERRTKQGWNTSDKILLSILTIFGTGMLIAIVQKRRSMSNKDALLEQAAMSAAGLQQAHIIGIFLLVVIIITVFALLDLKNLTWALLLIVNTVLFGYLMKLTIDSGVSTGETIIGPDGTIVRRVDSEDSSVDESSTPTGGSYMVPTLT